MQRQTHLSHLRIYHCEAMGLRAIPPRSLLSRSRICSQAAEVVVDGPPREAFGVRPACWRCRKVGEVRKREQTPRTPNASRSSVAALPRCDHRAAAVPWHASRLHRLSLSSRRGLGWEEAWGAASRRLGGKRGWNDHGGIMRSPGGLLGGAGRKGAFAEHKQRAASGDTDVMAQLYSLHALAVHPRAVLLIQV